MKKEFLRRFIGGILLVSLIALGFTKPVQEYLSIPMQVTLFEGQEQDFSNSLSVVANVDKNSETFEMNQGSDTVSLKATDQGKDEIVLELAGLPIKKVDVNVLKDFKVMPGGQSIGVKLNTVGVLVVGHHQVQSVEGKYSPGETAGIKVGDIITEINGKKIEKMADVGPFVQESGENGKPMNVIVKRESEKIRTTLEPKKDEHENIFKLGLYIRDSAAGIGTMTFFHPDT